MQTYFAPPGSLMTSGIATHADNAGRLAEAGATLSRTLDPPASSHRAAEPKRDDGHCKAIGLSDVNLEKLREIVAAARIKPAVVQVESHPYLPEWELLDFCREQGIVLLAFAALGHAMDPKVLEDSVITTIAQRVGKTPAQVALAGHTTWHRFPDHLEDTAPYSGEFRDFEHS